jgi:3alpha(or 20beta)-hydroxysteroid dehydrogenase
VTRLANKVALITGGARGLGASIARLFHAEGATVVIVDVRSEEGESLSSALGKRAQYVNLDVTNEAHWHTTLRDIEGVHGALHVLVNNAGIFRPKPLREITVEEYLLTIRINQLGCFLGMKHAAEAMATTGGGSIVNVASTAGVEGIAGAIHYTASKHAVVGMTKAAALELGRFGIRVNVVCPGAMATPLLAESFNTSVNALLAQQMTNTPLGRMGSADEVARAALFLASDEASYLTGSELRVDGGLTAGVMDESNELRAKGHAKEST